MRRRALALALLGSTAALAHQPSDAYLTLDCRGAPSLRVDLALRDLDDELGLDADGDGAVTWGEVRSQLPAVDALVAARVRFPGCRYAPARHGVASHSDGTYLVLEGPLDCAGSGPQALGYGLFFARDPQHRALVRLLARGADQTLIATASKRELALEVTAGAAAGVGRFFVEGVHHILIGWDHLLFLCALLLPSVLRRKGTLALGLSDWEPRQRLSSSLAEVLELVTAFTLAHSLTLALSALNVVELPGRLVESAIALTVVLAAVANLWPVVEEQRWGPAFTLGLVHGFGFSSVLRDSGLKGTSLVAELLGFNLGVEAGQLLFVSVVVPLCFVASRARAYPWLMRLGSALIAAFGAVWLYQRALGP